MGPKPKSGTGVQSIRRGINILRCFSETEPEIGVTVLSERLNLPKSTVFRILATLLQEGFVDQNPESGKYRLGLALISLAGVALGRLNVRGVAQPYLIDLVQRSRETVNVAVLDGPVCVYIEREPSPESIRYIGWIGRRTPLHCTASGKVFLAHMSPEERSAVLSDPLKQYTANTIRNQHTLEASLMRIFQQGYACDHEEFSQGFSAIAAPIFNHKGMVSATVVISGPTFRMGGEKMNDFIQPLCETAREISVQMGFAGVHKESHREPGRREAGR